MKEKQKVQQMMMKMMNESNNEQPLKIESGEMIICDQLTCHPLIQALASFLQWVSKFHPMEE